VKVATLSVTKREGKPLNCAHMFREAVSSAKRLRSGIAAAGPAYHFAAAPLAGQLKHSRMNFSVVIDRFGLDVSRHGAADFHAGQQRQKLVS
jgi:hypothetical protein